MKYLLVLFFLSFAIDYNLTSKSKKFILIVSNDPNERPVATDKEVFWLNKQYLDTIEVRSNRLYEFFVNRVNKLEKEDFDYVFSIKAAVLLYRKNKIYTLYTDRFFKNWYINGRNFTDNKKELMKMFGGFFLVQYDK